MQKLTNAIYFVLAVYMVISTFAFTYILFHPDEFTETACKPGQIQNHIINLIDSTQKHLFKKN